MISHFKLKIQREAIAFFRGGKIKIVLIEDHNLFFRVVLPLANFFREEMVIGYFYVLEIDLNLMIKRGDSMVIIWCLL